MQDIYSLAGDWRFRPGDDLAWSVPSYDDNEWSMRHIPGRWENRGFPDSHQRGWYRLTLKLDSRGKQSAEDSVLLGIRIGKILSAYELYAGGQLLGGIGKLPPLSEVNYDQIRVYLIPASAISDDGSLVLALRVWGGSDLAVSKWGGGPHESSFRIGSYTKLLQASYVNEIPNLMICVLFLGFGIYHLYLYRRNRQLLTYLWYGLTALDISIYALMSTQWRYHLDWGFVSYEKLEFGAIYLFPILLIQMLWSLVNVPINRLMRAYQLSFFVFIAVSALLPGLDGLYYTLNLYEIWAIPLIVVMPWLIVTQARAGNREARTALLGIIIFIATCVNDMTIDLVRWETVRLIPLGFVAIMLSMIISLANRFTTVLNNLEGEIALRTTELSTANLQLAETARRDPLTALLNRRGFIDEAQTEMQRFMRTGRGFSIILSDLDNFKEFNDERGHACGDYVLQQVAHILGERVRDMDEVARWGGEEFILMLPETRPEGAAQVAEELRSFIENKRFEYQGQRLSVTMTFGIASFRKGETLDNCIARADIAMYQGKQQGRNQVVVSKLLFT